MNLRLAFVLALTVTASACIPVPTVSPPLKAKLGGGLGVGDVTDESDASDPPNSTGIINVSIGVHPLQYWEETENFDLGVGFVGDFYPVQSLNEAGLVGGYLEAGYVVWTKGSTERSQGRLSILARTDLLTDAGVDTGTGFGLAAGLSLELISWQESGFASTSVETSDQGTEVTSFVGVAYGESGIGIELTGNLRDFGGQRYTALMAHIVFRIPTVAGFYLIPLF